MTTSIWLRDIGSYWLQAGVVVSAGAALAWLLRIRAPGAALTYWRALLLACLALPLCQPWHTVVPPPLAPANAAAIIHETARPVEPAPPSMLGLPSLERMAGVALRRGRRGPDALLVVGAHSGVCARRPCPRSGCRRASARRRTGWAPRAHLRLRDPSPDRSRSGPSGRSSSSRDRAIDAAARQEAIACHELLHVSRRDWIAALVEEGIRTLLWFHPAIWWLIDRIQLSREQVVDRATIGMTESRERYVEALLSVAKAKFAIALLIPASPFLKRRLLKERVAQILEGVHQTTRHIVASFGASAVAIVSRRRGARVPAAGPVPERRRDRGGGAPVQIVKGSEHLLHGDVPEYPRRAIEQKVEGDMLLELAIDDRGEVADARVLSGPDELRRTALRSVLQWHYAPPVRSTTVQVTLRFHAPQIPPGELEKKVAFAYTDGGDGAKLERQMKELEAAMADPNATPEQKAEIKAQHAERHMLYEKIQQERRGHEWATYEVQVEF